MIYVIVGGKRDLTKFDSSTKIVSLTWTRGDVPRHHEFKPFANIPKIEWSEDMVRRFEKSMEDFRKTLETLSRQ